MRADRLLLLADFLESKVPDDQWDYRKIVGLNWKGKDDLSCGTTACALGWATTIPELREAGLTLIGMMWESWFDVDGRAMFGSARDVFEITYGEVLYLFDPAYNSLGQGASALDVAVHIRAFVARGGIREEDQ